jgi:FlaA1/EpsC-like NDP-sugar epimerase
MIIDERQASVATSRAESFFMADLHEQKHAIDALYSGKKVLIIGGAGTIGSACALEALNRNPETLDIVDINENGLAALTRYIRSNGLGSRTSISFNALDFGGFPMAQFIANNGPWDTVLNFAAVKHVRSEKNVACVLHMLEVNAVKQYEFLQCLSSTHDQVNYFVVSTDKAANPANLMGASKRLLEYLLFGAVTGMPNIKLSSARFANVAFSAGSLLESFRQRYDAGYPLACPVDTRRYFISPKEAAHICLLGQVFAPTQTIVIPRMNPSDHLVQLADVASAFLNTVGCTAVFHPPGVPAPVKWDADQYPVLLSERDTIGEKEAEVFVGTGERVFDIGLSTIHAITPFVPDVVTAAQCYAELKALTTGAAGQVTRAAIETLVARNLGNYEQIIGANSLDDRV